ncbi:MAG: 2,3-bisphosphoglycerate-dependent phosphoglycerate mutase [Chloroflexota bacterium]|nr:2,3-bisphosphoglycerate-dependent phosphoglycerate mutase [Chloroflexota bacterium]
MKNASGQPRTDEIDSVQRVQLYLEMHSTSLDNEAGCASGHFDVGLSRLGENQATKVGERYRDTSLSAVYASDLQRAYRTAEIAFAGREIPIHRDRRLRECDYGAWTRHPAREVHEAAAAHVLTPFPGGESYEQVVERVGEFLEEVRTRLPGKAIVVVAHRAVLYALQNLLNGVPLADAVGQAFAYQPGWSFELPLPGQLG